jgi:hypothetical protein
MPQPEGIAPRQSDLELPGARAAMIVRFQSTERSKN